MSNVPELLRSTTRMPRSPSSAAVPGWRLRYCFRPAAAIRAYPVLSVADLEALVEGIGRRVGRQLERRGVLARGAASAWLDWDEAELSALDDLAGHAISYRTVRPA